MTQKSIANVWKKSIKEVNMETSNTLNTINQHFIQKQSHNIKFPRPHTYIFHSNSLPLRHFFHFIKLKSYVSDRSKSKKNHC